MVLFLTKKFLMTSWITQSEWRHEPLLYAWFSKVDSFGSADKVQPEWEPAQNPRRLRPRFQTGTRWIENHCFLSHDLSWNKCPVNENEGVLRLYAVTFSSLWLDLRFHRPSQRICLRNYWNMEQVEHFFCWWRSGARKRYTRTLTRR